MTSRRSSGSMRAESAVEPTRSENITVTWRRSASVFSRPVDCRKSVGWRRFRARVSAQGSNGVEQLTAMPENADA